MRHVCCPTKRNFPNASALFPKNYLYYRGEEGRLRSYTPLNPWQIVAGNDFVAGGFIWPGVDYLGEAGWPSKGWPNGLFDVCMFENLVPHTIVPCGIRNLWYILLY
ncbi:MAG: hypothetical protein ACLUE2_08465 [Bacteroides cellulosilyticus]